MAFDLDGTLIDARHRQVGVAVEVVREAGGVGLDTARFWRAKRDGSSTAGALVSLGLDPVLATTIADRWRARIEAAEWLAQDRALPGAVRVLGRLRAAGRRIAVLTARRSAEGAAASLDAAGLAPFVDELSVVDPGAAVAEKARALRAWRASSFIGDTEADGAASAEACVPFVAVTTGQRSSSYLAARGYHVARSLTAAVQRLERQRASTQ